jgi:hypothetical protein
MVGNFKEARAARLKLVEAAKAEHEMLACLYNIEDGLVTLRWPSGGHCRGGGLVPKYFSSAARLGVWGLAPIQERG